MSDHLNTIRSIRGKNAPSEKVEPLYNYGSQTQDKTSSSVISVIHGIVTVLLVCIVSFQQFQLSTLTQKTGEGFENVTERIVGMDGQIHSLNESLTNTDQKATLALEVLKRQHQKSKMCGIISALSLGTISRDMCSGTADLLEQASY